MNQHIRAQATKEPHLTPARHVTRALSLLLAGLLWLAITIGHNSAIAATGKNVALQANGGVATASSNYEATLYPAASVINGDRKGLNWDYGGAWIDATLNAFPDWVEIAFNGAHNISEINVFTIQDNFRAPLEPTEAMTFTLYGLSSFQVQYWNGTTWADVPGGNVTDNNRVWRKFTFAPVNTSRIRVLVNSGLGSYSRIAEIEAWTEPGMMHPIRGTVSADGLPVSGATFSTGAGGGSCEPSDSAGQYLCLVPQGYTGAITPRQSGYRFEPPSRSYGNVTTEINAQDYTASANPDTVWFDDSVPAASTLEGTSEGWYWVSSNPAPFSGFFAHQSALFSGVHQHYFYNTTNRLSVVAGESLFAYVYLDPLNPPSEVMLQWNDGTWEHRAYWGANLIGWGVDGTVSRRYMGALPPLGQWVRLEVPAAQVGLEGRQINGMAFTLYGGRATWDYVGKSAPRASYNVSGTVTANGAGLAGVSLGGAAGVSCSLTNGAGQYSCAVPQGYTGAITPLLGGYSFTPASRSYSNVLADQIGQNYAATGGAPVFTVSGTVTAGGAGLPSVIFPGAAGLTCNASNSLGQYACNVPQGYSGNIVPFLNGYTFTPPLRSYTNVTANQNGQDYTAPANVAPTIALTSPANGATFSTPGNITLTASASDSGGSITRVEFFHGSTLIGTVTNAPYTTTWSGVPQGTYVLIARATDNLGVMTTSAPVTVTVQAGLYFIHPDHLNTPRLITNTAQQVVWRWDNTDAFGNNAPNENPSGIGNFTCNLRLPGQYFDRETGLHYNYFRDYDPAIGRYVQSDPIGLYGGINTFAYVRDNPIGRRDPKGLIDNYDDFPSRYGNGGEERDLPSPFPPTLPMPNASVSVGMQIAGMNGKGGKASESGVAIDLAGRKICFYVQECDVGGLGMCFGGGLSLGGQQGGLSSGIVEQGGMTIMGGKGVAGDIQITIDKDGNFGGAKGYLGRGLGLGGGLIKCRTGYRCSNF